MANEKSFFDRLNNLFSTAILVRTKQSTKIRNIDIDRLQSVSNLETRRLAERLPNIYRTTATNAEYINVAGYNITRTQLYNEYDLMDRDPIISAAIDIYSEESISKNDMNKIMTIKSENQKVKENLENLFDDILDLDFNLYPWIRNLCKYGDFYLKLDLVEKIGVTGVIPLSPYAMIRLDNNLNQEVKFKYDNTLGVNIHGVSSVGIMSGNDKFFSNYEIAHFRLLSDTNFYPYGKSVLENARTVWKQIKLMEEAMLLQRIMRAPERRIFKIDVGNIAANQVDNYLEQVITRLKKVPYVDPNTGEYDLKFNLKPIAWYSKIPLLDGRVITIKQLAEEVQKGRTNWVYSINRDNNNKVTVGRILDCSLTKKDSELIRITIQDNSYLDLEPTHPIMLNTGEYKLTKDICVGDKFMPYKTKDINLYQEIYDPSKKQYTNILSLHPNYNSTVEETIECIKVETLDFVEDVYCMEVETHHNFAVLTSENTGFFVKNSSMEDFYFPVRGDKSGTEVDTLSGMEWNGIDDLNYLQCLRGNTEIKLLDGTSKSIKDITDDFSRKKYYTWSVNLNTLDLEPVEIIHAQKTRKDAEMVRVHIDNNEYIDCTPDHRFMLNSGIFVEAQELKVGILLMTTDEYDQDLYVSKLEYLTFREDTYDIEVSKNENFALATGIFVHNSKMLAGLKVPKAFLSFDEQLNSKAHLSSEDVRFSRSIERIQRMVINELTKIGIIHLYTQGFSDEDLTEFELELTTSSKLAEQERLELLGAKVTAAKDLKELKMFSDNWLYKNIFNISDDEINEQQEQLINDLKLTFRYGQIESEGNDPYKTFEKITDGDSEETEMSESYLSEPTDKIESLYRTHIKKKINKITKNKKNEFLKGLPNRKSNEKKLL